MFRFARRTLCLLLALGVVGTAGVATAASVSVVPADTTVSLGDSFYIRVEADAHPDLKAYQLIFQFDPTIVQLLPTVQHGDVLGSPGTYFATLVPDVSAPPDSAWYDAAKLLGTTAGPGVLVYYHFKAIAQGDTPLDCRRVDFRDSFNVQTLPACFGGMIRVRGVTPALPASWGRVKSLYR